MKFLQSFAWWAAPYHGNICKTMRLFETILAGCSFLISIIICNRYAAVVKLVVTSTYYIRQNKNKNKESTAVHCFRSTRRGFRLQPAPVAEAPIFMISKVHLRKLRV